MAKNLRVKRSCVTLSYGLWKHGLTPKAIGLLYTIISLSDIPDWEFSISGLVKVFEDSGTGRDSIQSGIKELEAARLLIRERVRDSSGKLAGSDWIVSDQPMEEAQPVTGFPAQAEPAPMTGFPAQGNPRQYENHGREEEQPPRTPFTTEVSEETAGLPKLGRVRLKPSDLPESLAPVAERLALWWNTAKQGGKSQDAYKRLLTELGKIQREGGIEAVSSQIEKGIKAKEETGKGWQSITHSNWLAYRPRSEALKAQEQALAAKPSHEQQEALELAQSRPELFQRAWFSDRGMAYVRFTDEAHAAASALKGEVYPWASATGTVEALRFEIAFLERAMEQATSDQGLDSFVCPF